MRSHNYINVTINVAKFGGGLALEAVSNLRIFKCDSYYYETNSQFEETYAGTIRFVANSADYGGAIYVNDDTDSATCSNTESDGFFQVLHTYNYDNYGYENVDHGLFKKLC